MTNQYNPEEYWDSVARKISSRDGVRIIAGDDDPYYRYKRGRLLELFHKIDFSNKVVLEVGCGPGGNLEFLSHRGVKKLYGVDISNQMISIASELLKDKNVDIIKINGTDLPFESNKFDIVFTSTVLQHNTDVVVLKKLLEEICRVSKDEVMFFERIERKIIGNESNTGRPIKYYEELLKLNGYNFTHAYAMPIQASYFLCGIIRKVFNPWNRLEGEPLSRISIILENIILPFTKAIDPLIPSKRDVMLLVFKKAK